MRGGLFREDFDPAAAPERKPGGKVPIYGRSDPERAAGLDRTLMRLSEARGRYHAARYTSPRMPDNDNRPSTFAQTLQQMITSPSIHVDRDMFLDTLRLDKEKKRRRVYHYNSLTGQVWVQEFEEETER